VTAFVAWLDFIVFSCVHESKQSYDSVFNNRLFFAKCFHVRCCNTLDQNPVWNLRSRI